MMQRKRDHNRLKDRLGWFHRRKVVYSSPSNFKPNKLKDNTHIIDFRQTDVWSIDFGEKKEYYPNQFSTIIKSRAQLSFRLSVIAHLNPQMNEDLFLDVGEYTINTPELCTLGFRFDEESKGFIVDKDAMDQLYNLIRYTWDKFEREGLRALQFRQIIYNWKEIYKQTAERIKPLIEGYDEFKLATMRLDFAATVRSVHPNFKVSDITPEMERAMYGIDWDFYRGKLGKDGAIFTDEDVIFYETKMVVNLIKSHNRTKDWGQRLYDAMIDIHSDEIRITKVEIAGRVGATPQTVLKYIRKNNLGSEMKRLNNDLENLRILNTFNDLENELGRRPSVNDVWRRLNCSIHKSKLSSILKFKSKHE